MYDIFKSIELDAAWLPALSEHAAGCGIAFAASAFDLPSLAALEGVAVPFHKVASSETTNLRLVGAMAATGKPLLLSTGMCELRDIVEAVRPCNGLGHAHLGLLPRRSPYPLPPEHANLRMLDDFRLTLGTAPGLPVHTLAN